MLNIPWAFLVFLESLGPNSFLVSLQYLALLSSNRYKGRKVERAPAGEAPKRVDPTCRAACCQVSVFPRKAEKIKAGSKFGTSNQVLRVNSSPGNVCLRDDCHLSSFFRDMVGRVQRVSGMVSFNALKPSKTKTQESKAVFSKALASATLTISTMLLRAQI